MAKTLGDEFLDVIEKRVGEIQKDEAMCIGKVVSLSPLIIRVDGLDLYENNLTISPHLKEWKETVNITTSTNDNHSHTIQEITHPSKLILNSRVFCYGYDYTNVSKTYQNYFVLVVI